MSRKINELCRSSLCVLLILAACAQACGQRYTFRSYTQGLGNLNIVSMVQDRTGYLWVGTQNGLYRYDGAQFQAFGPAQGVPERMIEALYVSVDGTLWVATTAGIYFELPSGQFAEVPPHGAEAFEPVADAPLASIRAGEVVLAVRGGAYRIRQVARNEWTAEPLKLEGTRIFSVLYTADGALWYGCDKDLCRMQNGKSEHMGARLKLPEERWEILLLARNGQLWIRGPEHIGAIDLKTLQYQEHTADLDGFPQTYMVLVEDAQGRILTLEGTRLALWEKGAWRRVTERNGLGSYELQSVFVDREGSVWLGEVGHGLKRWVGQDQWEAYTKADGLSSDLVWAVQRDTKGRLWVGSQAGLNWIENGQHTARTWQKGKTQMPPVSALTMGTDGSVWAASLAGGIARIDSNTLVARNWKVPSVSRVLADGQGHILIATSQGLYSVNERGGGVREIPELVQAPVFKNPKQRFTDLCLDDQKRLWAASDQGLLVRDVSGWHAIDMRSPKQMRPDVIAVDKMGAVWVAGPSQVMMRLRVENYSVLDAKPVGRPPLLSQQIVSLMVDSRGWLWVGQDLGVSMFDGRSWRSYTQDDGLIWNDTDSFALAEDPDGSIWVGTSGGLSHLITPVNQVQRVPQAPAFTKVTLSGNLLQNGGSIRWQSGTLEISLALLSFKSTNDSRVRYRLRGPHENTEWEESHEMRVRYRDLGPGLYRFEATEVDTAGRSVSPLAVFTFRITPRWWQMTWLRSVLGLIGVLVMVAIWRWRVGALLNKNRHLEAAVHARTKALEREKGQLVEAKNQLRHFAEHDDLTGLWNHRIIVERLRIEVDRSRREGLPLSIILVDLDFFKRINDTFGHPAGDAALKEASAIFQRMVRTYDWVGRYGGEEFLLILPGSSCTHAEHRAEELRHAISSARLKEGASTITMTASFGVACGYPTSHEELIQQADEALYRAKNKGRNCVVGVEVDAAGRHVKDVARLN